MTNYNDGKWHGWNGGECPVHPETVVEYAMVNSTSNEPARLLWWEHKGRTSDIIAFRVIKEHKEPREWWIKSVAPDGFMIDCKKDDPEAIHVREVLPE